MKKLIISALMASAVLTASLQAEVSIVSKSYQKVIKKKKPTWVKAAKVVPGSTVLYMNTLSNKGKETAEKLTVVKASATYVTRLTVEKHLESRKVFM